MTSNAQVINFEVAIHVYYTVTTFYHVSFLEFILHVLCLLREWVTFVVVIEGKICILKCELSNYYLELFLHENKLVNQWGYVVEIMLWNSIINLCESSVRVENCIQLPLSITQVLQLCELVAPSSNLNYKKGDKKGRCYWVFGWEENSL